MSTGASSITRVYFVNGTIDDAPPGGTGRLLLLEEGESMHLVTPGGVKDLIGTVVVSATGAPFIAAALCVIRLEQDGDPDDGKYWDADDDTWQVSPVTWPVSAHGEAGQHLFQLPAAATTGRGGARLSVTFADTVVEGSMTSLCGTREYMVGGLGLGVDALIVANRNTNTIVVGGVTYNVTDVGGVVTVTRA